MKLKGTKRNRRTLDEDQTVPCRRRGVGRVGGRVGKINTAVVGARFGQQQRLKTKWKGQRHAGGRKSRGPTKRLVPGFCSNDQGRKLDKLLEQLRTHPKTRTAQSTAFISVQHGMTKKPPCTGGYRSILAFCVPESSCFCQSAQLCILYQTPNSKSGTRYFENKARKRANN